MMAKSLKFVSCIILFFSIFLTAKAIQNDNLISFTECKDHKDCYDALVSEEIKGTSNNWWASSNVHEWILSYDRDHSLLVPK
jgi:hypothetical protein